MQEVTLTGHPPPPGTLATPTRADRWRAVSVVVLVAVIAGPITGWLHGAELLVEHGLLGRFTWFSRDFAWMAPVAYTGLMLVAAVPLAGLALWRPSMGRPVVAAAWFGTVMMFGLLLPYPALGRPASLLLAIGVGVQVGQAVARHHAWWARRGVRLAIGQLAVVGLTALALPWQRQRTERREEAALGPAPAAAPNVLVIILDTVRAASLSLYGYPYPTTPFLDRLAREGTTFDWAIAPAPWTLPSHAAFFTGRYPTELTANWKVPLDPKTPVLAEAFRARGYHTAAVVANHDYTAWDSGLLRGMVHREDYLTSVQQLLHSTSYTQTSMGLRLLKARHARQVWRAIRSMDFSIDPKHAGDPRRADRVTNAFLDWHATHRDRPFFAFLNYFDAHQGYYAPPGFPQLATPVSPDYHTAIAWIDANLETLVTTLRQRGVLDNTLVVIAADHGELFDEHGLNGHANNLYRNVLHVPLVIRYPGAVPAGQRITREVSLRDLAATVADLGGLAPDAFPGASLRHAWADASPLSPVVASVRSEPNVDPSFPTARGDMAALFEPTRHYIRNFGGGEELFAYRADPLETEDLTRAEPDVAAAMRARLDSAIAQFPDRTAVRHQ